MPKQFGVPDEVIQAVLSKELSPSAYSPYLSAIYGKHVIGINMAFKIGDWIDMVFFGDRGWFYANRKELAQFPGLKVTCHANLSGNRFDREYIKYLAKDRKHAKGISPNPRWVSWNANSGAAAISVAANAGVKRIVLLGFDMQVDEKHKQHWHGLYGTAKRGKIDKKRLPFDRHLRGFPIIAKDAKRRGIEILNVGSDSAIEDFRKVTLEEALN